MDFQELMNRADYNKAEAKSEAAIKRYSSALPPPKKSAKSNVMPDGVRRFLEKKKAEEIAKRDKARVEKEQLLAIRAQNSKNNKKAKIMASRTKDNDFSRIRLTEDEIETKKKIEEELTKKKLADKVERMKIRIEMEEKEKLLPKKRKRKSKTSAIAMFEEEMNRLNNHQSSDNEELKTEVRKQKKLPPPLNRSFSDLLKMAEVAQFEPVEVKKKVVDDDRLLTKKERKLRMEEEARLKRKQERLERGDSIYSNLSQKSSSDKDGKPNGGNIPAGASNFKIPKNSTSDSKQIAKVPDKRPVNLTRPTTSQKSLLDQNGSISAAGPDRTKPTNIHKKVERADKKPTSKVSPSSFKSVPQLMPTIDTDAIVADIERKLREKVEKEIEAKLLAKFGLNSDSASPPPKESVAKTPPQKSVPVPKAVKQTLNGKPPMRIECKTVVPKKPVENLKNSNQMPPKPRPPVKKQFNMNPYMDPPRRLLEPQRPPKMPQKRRLDSDDDDDDDDDMSDFIDDTPSQNEEDYTKYIKEIFGYDRNKYRDQDEEDIRETSFAEQMKEEIKSARAGYLEDLEEEKLERERLKRKMKKKK